MVRIAAVIVLFTANGVVMGNSYAPDGCVGTVVNIAGVVTSRPANLSNSTDVAGCLALKDAGDLPMEPLVCLRISVSGTVKASGYSVLTRVPLVAADGSVGTTPFCFPTDQTRGCVDAGGTPFPPTSAGMQGVSSKARLTGTVLGRKYSGTVLTKDQGFITPDGFVGQILLIEGGTGSFEGATGRAAVAGQEIGGVAYYTGHICVNPAP